MKKLVVISALALALVGGMTTKASAWGSWGSWGGWGGWDGGYDGGYTGGSNTGGSTTAPEPASLLLMGSGLVGLWAVNRKRK